MNDLVQRLRQEWMATQAATPMQLWVMVQKQQWLDCTGLTREAADEIERLHREIESSRIALMQAKNHNVRLLSQLQEYEAREQ